MQTISAVWANRMREEIHNYQRSREDNQTLPIISVTTHYTICLQWLVEELTRNSIPFKVLQLGAGVKQVTTEVDICPKCHGTGRC